MQNLDDDQFRKNVDKLQNFRHQPVRLCDIWQSWFLVLCMVCPIYWFYHNLDSQFNSLDSFFL